MGSMGLISADNDKALSIQYLKNRIIKRRTSQPVNFCADALFLFFKWVNKKAKPIISLSFIF